MTQYQRNRTTHQTETGARQKAALDILSGAGMVEVWNTTAAALYFLGDNDGGEETVWLCDVYSPHKDDTMKYEIVGSLALSLGLVDAERGVPTEDEDAAEQNLPLPGALALEVARKVKPMGDNFGFEDED